MFNILDKAAQIRGRFKEKRKQFSLDFLLAPRAPNRYVQCACASVEVPHSPEGLSYFLSRGGVLSCFAYIKSC